MLHFIPREVYTIHDRNRAVTALEDINATVESTTDVCLIVNRIKNGGKKYVTGIK